MPRINKKLLQEQARQNKKKLLYSFFSLLSFTAIIVVVNPDGPDTTSILLFSFLFTCIIASFFVFLTTLLSTNKFLHDLFFSQFFRFGTRYASRSARARRQYEKIRQHEALYGVRKTDKITTIYLLCIVFGFALFFALVNDPYFDSYLPYFVIGFLVSFFIYVFLIAPRINRK